VCQGYLFFDNIIKPLQYFTLVKKNITLRGCLGFLTP
jgi:hypothetical protein